MVSKLYKLTCGQKKKLAEEKKTLGMQKAEKKSCLILSQRYTFTEDNIYIKYKSG